MTILRDGFTTDGDDPAGLYFGSRSGEVYGSADSGDSWQLLAAHLPPVLSVRAAPRVVGASVHGHTACGCRPHCGSWAEGR